MKSVASEPQAAAPETAENRSATRLPASLVPNITGVRLSPHGTDAKLVNISATGVLVECTSRLKPGSVVTVIFDGGFSPATISGRVARSSVAGIGRDGALRYHIGIAFKHGINLADAPAPAVVHEEVAPAAVEAPQAVPPLPESGPAPKAVYNRW